MAFFVSPEIALLQKRYFRGEMAVMAVVSQGFSYLPNVPHFSALFEGQPGRWRDKNDIQKTVRRFVWYALSMLTVFYFTVLHRGSISIRPTPFCCPVNWKRAFFNFTNNPLATQPARCCCCPKGHTLFRLICWIDFSRKRWHDGVPERGTQKDD